MHGMAGRITIFLAGVLIGGALVAAALLLSDPNAAELAKAKRDVAKLESQIAAANAAPADLPAEFDEPTPVEVADEPPEHEFDAGIFSASAFYSQFQANEIAANDRFKGRLVVVYGPIADIGTDITGAPYVAIAADDSIGLVQCMFDSSDGLGDLSEGDEIRIKGRCSGLMMNVILRESMIVGESYQ